MTAELEPLETRPARRSLPLSLLRLARPRQWAKNVLVFAAPGAAGVLGHRADLAHTFVAFAAFCIAASGTYYINDALDYEADRLHHRKRLRPVAAGDVGVGLAFILGSLLLGGAIALSLALTTWQLAATIGVYTVITLSYSLWLKDQAVIELAAVASGFILRAIAGAVATQVFISNWFVIVVSSGAMFMVAGKRHGEHLDLGDERGSHRATLELYSMSFLRYVRGTCSAVAVTAYCLWAFERAGGGHAGLAWFELSIVPFVLAILRYALLVENGLGSAPEDIVLGDRQLQLLGVLWVASFGLGVYLR